MTSVSIEYPFYLLVDRVSGSSIPDLVPVAVDIRIPKEPPRRCLSVYRTRAVAAVAIEREEGRFRPYAILSERMLDRLAVVAIGKFKVPWLALEPVPEGLPEAFVSLPSWLASRRPWDPPILALWGAVGLPTEEIGLAGQVERIWG